MEMQRLRRVALTLALLAPVLPGCELTGHVPEVQVPHLYRYSNKEVCTALRQLLRPLPVETSWPRLERNSDGTAIELRYSEGIAYLPLTGEPKVYFDADPFPLTAEDKKRLDSLDEPNLPMKGAIFTDFTDDGFPFAWCYRRGKGLHLWNGPLPVGGKWRESGFDPAGIYYFATQDRGILRLASVDNPGKSLLTLRDGAPALIFTKGDILYLCFNYVRDRPGKGSEIRIDTYDKTESGFTKRQSHYITKPGERSTGFFVEDLDPFSDSVLVAERYDSLLAGLSRRYVYDMEKEKLTCVGNAEGYARFLAGDVLGRYLEPRKDVAKAQSGSAEG